MRDNLFEQNLTALGSIYPGLANAVQSRKSTSLDRSKPRTAFHIDPTAELYVLFRFEGIEQVNKVLKCIQDLELHAEMNRRLLLIDDRLPRFRALLENEDWRDVIRADHILLVVSNDMRSTLPVFLSRHGDVARCRKTFLWGDADTSQHTRDAIVSLFEEAQKRDERTCYYTQHYEQICIPPFPKTIHFISAGHNYLQDASVDALKRLGYGAQRIAWQNPLYRFIRSSAWLNRMAQENADTAFFVNSTPKTFSRYALPEHIPYTNMAWFVDNPRRYIREAKELGECDVIGVFDKTYIPFLQKITNAPVVEVRTGYGICRSSEEPKNDDKNMTITFVGELGTRGFLSLEQILKQVNSDQVNVLNQLLQDIDFSQPYDFNSFIEKELTNSGQNYHGAWVEFFENKATMLRRRHYLEAIADRGLTIFGDEEWSRYEWAGALADCYTGKRLDYFRELPNVYASSTININLFHVQCVSTPNPRVYDVLACGGFLLTSYNPGLEDEFTIGEDFDVFTSREELREKVDFYLAHPEIRQQIARNGQKRVLAHCGYDDRMQIFLNTLSSKTRNAYVYIR